MGRNGGSIPAGKAFFKIGEVSQLTATEPYVLRYWETEFKKLAPVKSEKGQRLYRPQDVQTILEIKRLLYQEGYTIAGARKALAEGSRPVAEKPSVGSHDELLHYLRNELASILTLLSKR
jgi:DNA-binding transcriptional MerR regulator